MDREGDSAWIVLFLYVEVLKKWKLFRSSLGIVGINLRLIEVLYLKSLILIFLRNGKSINKTVCSGLLQDFK